MPAGWLQEIGQSFPIKMKKLKACGMLPNRRLYRPLSRQCDH